MLRLLDGVSLRWLERVLVFFDAIYLGVEIFRLDFASHDQILPQNNDNIKVLIFCRFNLVPRVFSLFKMAAAREKTLAHSRSCVSNEDGDVFKMAATAKRVRRTGYEMLR